MPPFVPISINRNIRATEGRHSGVFAPSTLLRTSALRRVFALQSAGGGVEFLLYMAGRIIIDAERCKGCGLCVTVCPKGGIAISKISNKAGYFHAEAKNADCTGCSVCAIICPDAVIEVLCDKNIIAVKSNRKQVQNQPCKDGVGKK